MTSFATILRNPIPFIILALVFISLSCKKVQEDTSSNPTTSGIMLYGNPYGNTLKSFGKTADGGFYFAGYTNSSAGSNQQGFIQKTDKNGKIMWYHEYGGKHDDEFYKAHQTADGGFIAVGITSSLALDTPQLSYSAEAYVVKTDANGNPLWQKVFGGPVNGSFRDVAETPDHDFIITGDYMVTTHFTSQECLYVVKLDQNGDSLWTYKTTAFPGSFGSSVAVASDGSIGVTGVAQKNDTALPHPVFGYFSPTGKVIDPVMEFNGIFVRDDIFGASIDPIQHAKILNAPGGFIFIVGGDILPDITTYYFGSNYYYQSIIARKIDYQGNLVWNYVFNGKGNGVSFSSVIMNPDGTLLISGNVPNSSCLLNLDASGIKTSEIYLPNIGFTEGGVSVGNSYALGLNLIPTLSNHVYYFGLAIADQNGKIK